MNDKNNIINIKLQLIHNNKNKVHEAYIQVKNHDWKFSYLI